MAHFECVQYLIVRLDVIPTEVGKAAVAKEKAAAEKESVEVKERAEKAKKLAKQQAAENEVAQKAANLEQMELERQRFELEERKKDAETKREREQKEYERAEAARIQAELQEAAEARAARKAQNPFACETYTVRLENGSNLDTYTIVFTGVSECSVTVSSLDAANRESTFTASGSYSYSGEIFSLDVIMRGSPVKHLQALHWKSAVAFKNGYGVAVLIIPVSSSASAKRVKAEFMRK